MINKKTFNSTHFLVGLIAGALVTFGFLQFAPRALSISNKSEGVPLYAIIEVNWDGTGKGDWKVWGPKYDPKVGGDVLAECTDCLDMNYNFEFKGKTVQFDETYVSTVDGKPQTHQVVLTDVDGDGTYTGSLPSARYNLQEGYIYIDKIDYQAKFDGHKLTNMKYFEYEHKKSVE